MREEEFKASNRWLLNFWKRNGLTSQQKRNKKSQSVQERLPKVQNFHHDCVYLAALEPPYVFAWSVILGCSFYLFPILQWNLFSKKISELCHLGDSRLSCVEICVHLRCHCAGTYLYSCPEIINVYVDIFTNFENSLLELQWVPKLEKLQKMVSVSKTRGNFTLILFSA